jgi:hypothetical protein
MPYTQFFHFTPFLNKKSQFPNLRNFILVGNPNVTVEHLKLQFEVIVISFDIESYQP